MAGVESMIGDNDEPLDLETEAGDDPNLELDDDQPEGEGEQQEAQPEPEGFDIQIEGEAAEDETPLVKQLRQQIRARDKQLAETRTQAAPMELGKEPDLWEDCEGDPDRFKAEMRAYDKRKQEIEQQTAAETQQRQQADRVQQQEFAQYRAKAAAMPVPDFEDAENAVVAALSIYQQNAILKYASDPAKVTYALAKHPAKLAALADEPDLGRFVIGIIRMEDKIVVNRRTPPAPEAQTIQRGSASLSGGTDKILSKLEAQAEKTGDYSKVVAHKSKGRK